MAWVLVRDCTGGRDAGRDEYLGEKPANASTHAFWVC
jgi:hypothetical protein